MKAPPCDGRRKELVIFDCLCYNICGSTVDPEGTPKTADGRSPRKGVIRMVTYEALFAFCMVILGVITLVVTITRGDK